MREPHLPPHCVNAHPAGLCRFRPACYTGSTLEAGGSQQLASERTVTPGRIPTAMDFKRSRLARSTADRRRQAMVFAGSLLAIGALSGCSLTISQGVRDAQLTVEVKTALVNDPVVGPQLIEVSVAGGVVRLSGELRSQEDIARAIGVARSVAGVVEVTSDLRLAPPVVPPPPGRRYRPAREGGMAEPEERWPHLLAAGASLGISRPRDESIGDSVSGGPILAIRRHASLGFVFAFSWFRGDLLTEDGRASFGTLRVRPVMGGLGYTFSRDRASATISLSAGPAFNSFTINPDLGSELKAVAVGNSLAWRAGVGVAYRINRRFSMTGFAGYEATRPTVTFVNGPTVFKRSMNADTVLVNVGLAYWVF
ncbi:MAG: BON domain-containing protein [Rhodospirillaceae bacterium]